MNGIRLYGKRLTRHREKTGRVYEKSVMNIDHLCFNIKDAWTDASPNELDARRPAEASLPGAKDPRVVVLGLTPQLHKDQSLC